jgi:hypothetical protein
MHKNCAVVLIALSLLCFQAFAQTSQLSGTVLDPSGAVVANAELRLENKERGIVRESKTDATGTYTFPQLQPGTYSLAAKAQGFNDVIVNNVVLEVGKPATLTVTFERVGGTNTVVSVSAEGTQVNTTDASVGNVIGTTAILELPSFARNIAGLLAFQPGVTAPRSEGSLSRPTQNSDDRNGAVNGGRADQANVTLDGMDVNQQGNRNSFTSVLRTTLDSTQEFRSTTSGATAELGRSSGAQIQLVTRSGTNSLSGAVYWYHRNTIMAANSFLNNAAGVKRPALLINIPGGRLGGAIVKNKLFYFLNFETRRDASSENSPVRLVPSMALRQGIITYRDSARNIQTVGPEQLRSLDPAGLGVNQAALRVLQSYKAPNDFSAGDGLNIQGYRFTFPVQSKQDTYISKFDYNLGSRHQFYWRGNLQNDRSTGAPQFDGQPPNSVSLTNAKGYVIGHTATLSPTLISTFRYGLTRQSFEDSGVRTTPWTEFRGFSPINGVTRGISRTIPVHQITQDFSWTKGSHDIRVGGVMRWITNGSINFNRAFSSGITNVSWLQGVGSNLRPANLAATDVNLYGTAAVALLGIVSQVTSRYNYNVDGSLLAQGQPVVRSFKNEEYEWYISDSWRLKKNMTLTLGVRHSLMPSPYEANGNQLSTNIPLGQWFDARQGLADRGLSQTGVGAISYIPANSPAGRPLYPFHKNNFAPRAALAYSPNADGKLGKFLFGGPGKTSIRAGWGMYYDIIGQPLTVSYDGVAFGLATDLVNPSGVQTAQSAPRFTSFDSIPPSLLQPAPPGQFPATPPNNAAITSTIDDNLQMPYVMRQNFSIGREFKDGLYIEVGYVGSLSRKNLIQRDLAMPTNPTDPASGQTYFEAATQMALSARANQSVNNLAPLPFFENFYRTWAGSGRTATQNIYNYFRNNVDPNDFITTLYDIDMTCNNTSRPCSAQGRNLQFNPQFSALAAWSSLGTASYHAFQATARKRFSASLLLDFNYTWSKSIDLGSRAEATGNFPTGSFLINSFNPKQRRGVSDYDQRHIYNAFMYYELPFGTGKRFGSSSGRLMNALIGGWSFAPTWQMSTELPTDVFATGVWPTNWNITSRATPIGGVQRPVETLTKNSGPPNVFANPQAAAASFDYSLPGQSGVRNAIRMDGTFNINLAIAKRFIMPWSEKHKVQLRFETYNLLNNVRFRDPSIDISAGPTFGRYTLLLNSPREVQVAFRYDF